MDTYIREIQLANMLGYTEAEEFRRAVSRGEVPPPSHYLAARKKKPVWARADIEEWLGKKTRQAECDDFMALADRVV